MEVSPCWSERDVTRTPFGNSDPLPSDIRSSRCVAVLLMSDYRSPVFERYIGIDYSGAQTPTSSLSGLRVYAADDKSEPAEVNPPVGLKKYWTRRGVAEWLARQLSANGPVVVGIDHGFSFPVDYFERHALPHDWPFVPGRLPAPLAD